MNKIRTDYWMLNIAVVLWAMTAIFAKAIPLPADALIWFRSVIGVFGLAVFIYATGASVRLPRMLMGWMALMGILMCAHWVTFFHAAQVTDVGLALLALYTYPIITTFLEPLVSRERVQWSDGLIGVAMLGALYIMTPSFDLHDLGLQGILSGLVSAFLFSLRNLISRYKMQNISGISQMFYQVLITAIVLIPLSMHRTDLSGFDPIDWVQLLALSWFFVLVPHTLFMISLKTIKAQTASLIATIQPVYGVLFAYLFLAEVPTTNTIVGGSILLLLVVVETAKHYKTAAR